MKIYCMSIFTIWMHCAWVWLTKPYTSNFCPVCIMFSMVSVTTEVLIWLHQHCSGQSWFLHTEGYRPSSSWGTWKCQLGWKTHQSLASRWSELTDESLWFPIGHITHLLTAEIPHHIVHKNSHILYWHMDILLGPAALEWPVLDTLTLLSLLQVINDGSHGASWSKQSVRRGAEWLFWKFYITFLHKCNAFHFTQEKCANSYNINFRNAPAYL